MKKRVAKKILKNKDKLKYKPSQIAKAELKMQKLNNSSKEQKKSSK